MITDVVGPHIVLCGNFGAGNLGNECTLQAMLYNTQRYFAPRAIGCMCTRPEEIAATYQIAAFPIREKPLPLINNWALRILRRTFIGIPRELYRGFKAIRRLKSTDMLIMTGTGMLSDFGIRPFDLHYDILRWSIAARLCRCKLLFVSVGLGPIRHPLSRVFVKASLALANYRSYRDSFSKEYLKAMGFKTDSDSVFPDLAFSFPKAMLPRTRGPVRQKAVIGIGVMTYYNRRASVENDDANYRGYLSRIATFVLWLLEHRYTVRLLIGDVAYDERARLDLREVLAGVGLKYEDTRIIDEPACSVEEVLSQLAETDVVVASRFHNVLLALMLNKLVVAISYHEKVDALMAAIGLAEFCQDIEHIDVDMLIGQFITIQENSANLKALIAQKTESYRKALDEQYDRIFKGLRADL